MNIVLFLLVLKNMDIKISKVIVLPFFYIGMKQDLLSFGKNRYKKVWKQTVGNICGPKKGKK